MKKTYARLYAFGLAKVAVEIALYRAFRRKGKGLARVFRMPKNSGVDEGFRMAWNHVGRGQEMGMNKFRDVIAAVTLLGIPPQRGKESDACTCILHASERVRIISWLKVDVSHVACQMDISQTAGYYAAVRCM